MKAYRVALIFAIIIGIGAGTLFFSMPYIMTITYDDSQLRPLSTIYNMNINQTHTVQLSIANISGTNIFEETYILGPGESVTPDIYAPNTTEDYNFRVVVDQCIVSEALLNMGPTRVAVIEISSSSDTEEISFSIIDITPSGHYRFFWE